MLILPLFSRHLCVVFFCTLEYFARLFYNCLLIAIFFVTVTGTKIVFIDLGESFVDNIYRPSVSQSRLEALVDPLDTVSPDLVLSPPFY